MIKIDDLQELCEILKKDLSDISNKRNDIEEKIKNIKINFENLMSNYRTEIKKMHDDLLETIRKNKEKNFDKITEENEEVYNNMEEEKYDDEDDDNLLLASSLIEVKYLGKNIDMLKTQYLFKNRNEEIENRSKVARIIKKNWNEICYIYDDYDIHDVYFEIKAVGLNSLSYFTSCSHIFDRENIIGTIIEILDLEIDGKKSKYTYGNYFLNFSIKLKNLEKAKIHLKYKERPNYNNMNANQKAVYLYFRVYMYGLSEKLEGQMGKIRLILKGNFEIVSFEEDFFIRNIENKREKEYIWGGKIPPGGKRTLTKLSKKEAIWNVSFVSHFISRSGNIRNATLTVPTGF